MAVKANNTIAIETALEGSTALLCPICGRIYFYWKEIAATYPDAPVCDIHSRPLVPIDQAPSPVGS